MLIRAWLAQPICWDGYDPITLEGALQFAVCILETGRMPDDVFSDCPPTATIEDTDIAIPICDAPIDFGGTKSLPIALISCGWFSPDATATVRWQNSRVRAEQYNLPQVNTASDWSKSVRRTRATITALHVDFWATGDAELLRRLLPEVGALSAARFALMGAVLGWEIIESSEPCWPTWQGGHGQLMRTMPSGYMNNSVGFDTRPATLRAPYWHKLTMALCDVPIQRIGQ